MEFYTVEWALRRFPPDPQWYLDLMMSQSDQPRGTLTMKVTRTDAGEYIVASDPPPAPAPSSEGISIHTRSADRPDPERYVPVTLVSARCPIAIGQKIEYLGPTHEWNAGEVIKAGNGPVYTIRLADGVITECSVADLRLASLEGLTLRIQVLHRMGWTVREDNLEGLRVYSLHDPEGRAVKTLLATPQNAWEAAPAVESSVDAVLLHIKLGGRRYWETKQGPFNCFATIVDGNDPTPFAALHPSLASAMCLAFEMMKAGH